MQSANVALGKAMASGMSRREASQTNSAISCEEITASGSPVFAECCTCTRYQLAYTNMHWHGRHRTMATSATICPGSQPIIRSSTHARAGPAGASLIACRPCYTIGISAIAQRMFAAARFLRNALIGIRDSTANVDGGDAHFAQSQRIQLTKSCARYCLSRHRHVCGLSTTEPRQRNSTLLVGADED